MLPKSSHGTLEAETLVGLVARIGKCLIAGCTDDQADVVAKASCSCYEDMDISKFEKWMLRLAQLFCNTDSDDHISAFLIGLKVRISRTTIQVAGSEVALKVSFIISK